MTSPAMEEATLWCVNIQGPDDVIPKPDYISAIKAANAFNAFWQSLKEKKGQRVYDPRMWAIPIEWPHSAQSHAESLANPSPEYEWLNNSLASMNVLLDALQKRQIKP